MGDCYSIDLEVNLRDENKAIAALREYIAGGGDDGNANFSLDEYAKQDVTQDTFDGLMSIFFAGWERQRVCVEKSTGGWTRYRNDFDASYGWQGVMWGMFEVLAPFCEDGTSLTISDSEGWMTREVCGGQEVDGDSGRHDEDEDDEI